MSHTPLASIWCRPTACCKSMINTCPHCNVVEEMAEHQSWFRSVRHTSRPGNRYGLPITEERTTDLRRLRPLELPRKDWGGDPFLRPKMRESTTNCTTSLEHIESLQQIPANPSTGIWSYLCCVFLARLVANPFDRSQSYSGT